MKKAQSLESNYYRLNKVKKDPGRRYPRYGVEIELRIKEAFHTRAYVTSIDKTGKLNSYTYKQEVLDTLLPRVKKGLIGKDGSNLEIRYLPGTKKNLADTIKKLYQDGLPIVEKNQPARAGIHVHSDIRNYKPSEIWKNMKFLCSKKPTIIRLVEKVSRRSTRDKQNYGYLPSFETLCKQTDEFKRSSLREGIYLHSGHGTHEFRIFKSASNFVEAVACLEFVDALLKFSRSEEWEESKDKFLKFIEKTEYNNLMEVVSA